MTPTSVLVGLLMLFILSWIAAAVWAGRTVAAMPERAQWRLLAGGVSGMLLLAAARVSFPVLQVPLWEENFALGWSMVAASVVGYAWCWWARVYLGDLWSAGISRKEGHRVVDTGPYGIVRHPIYTGAILVSIAFAAAHATALSILMALAVAVFFACKARVEERFLQDELGAAYANYRHRVPMLVPFLRRRRPPQ